MGSSKKQTVGYRYFAKLMMVIGNPIEKLLGVNFDNRGWIMHDPLKHSPNSLPIDAPNLYGENEGGVAGNIKIYKGEKVQEPDPDYVSHMSSLNLPASAYPYLSYLVFKGQGAINGFAGKFFPQQHDGFYFGNSGFMKEMLLWPKRTRIRNDGRAQWYEVREDGAVVCEIGSYKLYDASEYYLETPDLNLEIKTVRNDPDANITEYPTVIYKKPNQWVIENQNGVSTDLRAEKNTSLPTDLSWSFIAPPELSGIFELNLRYYSLAKNSVFRYLGDAEILSKEEHEIETPDSEERIYLLKYVFKIVPKNNISFNLAAEGSLQADENSWRLTAGIVRLSLSKAYRTYNIENYNFGFDINPIHKIREILTDDTAMNKPESDINDENFMKAADRIYSEGLGISWAITEKSCKDALDEVCSHIEAGVRVNRQTGKYEVILFRDDWLDLNNALEFNESNIKSLNLEVINSDDAINTLNINYYDRTNIKNSAFNVYENGLIQTMGFESAETVDFPYFMNLRNAEIVANWKLKQLSTPAWRGSFTTGMYEARKLNRYDVIKLTWRSKGIINLPVRVMKLNLGDGRDNSVTIDFVEIIPYSTMLNAEINADNTNNQPLPPQPCQYEPFELPYYLAVMALGQRQVDDELAYESNFGLVGVVAEKPQSNSLYAIMMTHDETEGEEWTRAATIDYSPTADLDQTISKTATSLTVKNRKNLTDLPSGTLIKCGSDWIGTPGEFMVLQSIDAYTGIITVKRGALDTMPQPWDPNVKLYFCGSDIPFDETEYVLGEKVLVSALTTTPSGVLEQKGSIPVEIQARAIRPYPPANVKLNGVYFPETHLVTRDLTITWADRNRLQQTGGELLGFYDAGVTVEPGVTYSYELSSGNSILEAKTDLVGNLAVIPTSILIPNKPHTLKLWSTRDGYDSYQKFEHSFFVEAASLILTASTDGSKVSGNTVPLANITVDADTTLKANMKFDGLSISGKAPAGSTITIEVEE